MAIGYQLKITIRGSRPPIWRRVIVPEHIAFCDLDDIIEKIFGWTHSHLYEFYIKDWNMRFTGAPLMEEEDNAEECIDSWIKEGAEIIYTYDFGDNWEHLIKVEKFVEYENRYPVVLKSKGPNMIEDCGGMWGFYDYIEDAEPFDIDAVNEEFRSWVLPIAEPIEELMGLFDDEDDFVDDAEADFLNCFEEWDDISESEEKIREMFRELNSLEQIYAQYPKDNLIEIAKAHHLSGYSKYKKQRLVEWLVRNILEEQFMLNFVFDASKEELEHFQAAIDQKGIFIPESIVEESLFLSTYGGYLPYYKFYQVPVDVQEQYKKIMTDSVRKRVNTAHTFEEICQSAIYLYGVISSSELYKICEKYRFVDLSENEMQENMIDVARKDELLVFQNGYLMDVRLTEEDVYLHIIDDHKKIERYLPEDAEVFFAFGRNEVQEVDNDTIFFLEYLMKEANLDYPRGLLAFYLIQEAIRMNQEDVELFGILSDLGCSLARKKQFDKADQMLRKIRNRTRKWELNGHTTMELNKGIVEFPVNRRVYPNDLCPCGSGKKYKHCCGKK